MTKPKNGWTCPRGCSQQPCPHSQAAADSVRRDSKLARETLEKKKDKDDG